MLEFTWERKDNMQFKAQSTIIDARPYNLGQNVLELYNVLIQIRLTTSKTKPDV